MPKHRSRKISSKDVKLLWGKAAARCCFPGCRIYCIADATGLDPSAVLGEIAHIVAHSDDGPRCDPKFPEVNRNRYENLILLCGTHHTLIDSQENTYTVETLRGWKTEHEDWVRKELEYNINRISSVELEVVCKAIAGKQMESSRDFSLLPPVAKMARNGLTDSVTHLLRIGMAASKEVATYLTGMADVDPNFGERLKAGFKTVYNSCKVSGFEGDSLFDEVAARIGNGFEDFRMRAAAIAVLTYMFESCEIFEQ